MKYSGNQEYSPKRYDIVAQLLHWSMALILVYLIFFSHFEDLADEVMISSIKLHSGLGLLIIFLAALRWYWRKTHGVASAWQGVYPIQ